MEPTRFLVACGLTVWLGGVIAVASYMSQRMRFPRSLATGYFTWIPAQIRVPIGLLIFASYAYVYPSVALPFTVFTSGLVAYVLGAYVVALRIERRRAERLGLPEPGTGGTLSLAESVVFLAIALPCAMVAMALTGYGIANELGGNGSEGGAGLALGAMAWFLAIVMGLFALPLLIVRSRR